MKLCGFVIVVGVLIVAAAAQEGRCEVPDPIPLELNCNNIISDFACERYRTDEDGPGCEEIGIRRNCRAACGVCDSFENIRPTADIALLYGGNHIITWDRLPYDCTGVGEFVLYTNSRTGMKVHALLTAPADGGNSVPTAVSTIGSRGEKRLQIAVDRAASTGTSCNLLFWVGEEAVTAEQAGSLGGYKGIKQFKDSSSDRLEYKLDTRSGAQIKVVVRKERGCYFEQVKVLLTCGLKKDSKGLLGTPDNNIYNDWHGRAGQVFGIPGRFGRHLRIAYDYTRFNWCIRYEFGSIIKYDGIGSFSSNSKCDAVYDGPTSLSPTESDPIRQVCGEFNYECLQESFSTNAREGIYTLSLMEESENETVPEFKDGLSVQPRGVPANKSWTITVAVKFHKFEPELNGFGLVEVDEDSLILSRNVIAFLTDDGDSSKGDAKRLDKYFTDQITVNLGNGHSKGYAAVPLINGVYAFDREDLIMTLPSAVRGYSVASDRSEASADENRRQINLSTLDGVFIDIRLEGPRDREPIIAGAKFLNEYVGDRACGPKYEQSNYLKCNNCEAGGPGDVSTISLTLWKARREEGFTNAELFIEGFFLGDIWSMDDPESVPVKIVARVRKGDGLRGSLTMAVPAKQIMIIDDEETAYCTKDFPETLLGAIRILKNSKRNRWQLSFSESHTV